MPVEILEADLNRTEHQQAILNMMDAYARDPMGDGQPSDRAREVYAAAGFARAVYVEAAGGSLHLAKAL